MRRKLFISECLTGKYCFEQFGKDIFDKDYIGLNLCWNRLCDIGFEQLKIDADLRDADMGKWISSLACCNSSECADLLDSITGDRPLLDPVLLSAKCPPGCGCDAPWQFVFK